MSKKIVLNIRKIEDTDISIGLYNKLKKKGIKYTYEIPRKQDLESLDKKHLVELIKKIASFS